MESFNRNNKTYNLQGQKVILAAQPSLQLSTGLCTGTIPPDIDTTLMENRLSVIFGLKMKTMK